MYIISDKGAAHHFTLNDKIATIRCFLGRREHENEPITGIGVCIAYGDSERMRFQALANLRNFDFAYARRVLEIFLPAIMRAKAKGRSIERRAIWSSLMLVSFHQKRLRLPDLGRVQRFMTGLEIDHLQEILQALGISSSAVEEVIRSGRRYSIPDSRPTMTVPKQTRGTAPLTMSPEHPFWQKTGT